MHQFHWQYIDFYFTKVVPSIICLGFFFSLNVFHPVKNKCSRIQQSWTKLSAQHSPELCIIKVGFNTLISETAVVLAMCIQ